MRTALLILLMASAQPAAAERDAVVGYWSTGDSIFEVYQDDDTLYGQIRVLISPTYESGERPGFEGEPRADTENPDEDLRGRPLVGLHMFSEYEYADGRWQGKIYDPESGNTYQSRMTVNDDGQLEIRGYVGMPMFGRTATFPPATSCSDNDQQMIEAADLPISC